jgi:hypothetical protein
MSLAKTEFTNAGRSMLGRAQNGETLTITKLVVGSGAALVPSDLWPLVVLIHPVLDVTISATRDYGNGTLLIEGSFNSEVLTAAFSLREIGVMAHIASEGDRLYAVANVFTDEPDVLDPAVPTVQALKVKLIIDRIPTGDVVVSIGESENVLGENVGADTVGPGPFKEAVGNVLRFKRFEEGPGISLIQDPTESKIKIQVRQLETNVDLYVPESHPGAPNPDVAFPSIQAAHDYLLQFAIPSSKIATIHVYKGTFTSNTAILINHPDAQQIVIIGEPRVDKVVASIAYVNATTKRLAIGDVSGLSATLRGYVANCAVPWAGGGQILGTPRPNDVLMTIEKRDSRADYTTADTHSGIRFSYLPTVVICTASPSTMNPVFSCPYGIARFENILAVGAWAGFSLRDGSIKNCMVFGSTRGVNNAGGTVDLANECCFTQCDFGITGLGVVTAFDQTYINACTTGIAPSGSGFAIGSITGGMPDAIVYLVHNVYGILAVAGGQFQGGTLLYAYNDNGLVAQVRSVISVTAASNISAPLVNGIDLNARGMSYIEYQKGAGPTPSCNPTAETIGNQNSFIHVT